jgi:hypothetical protein
MAILLPRMERSSSSDISPMSLPLNLIRPPTIFPMLDRSRMMPSDTVDLPQPDSPTMPIASPGMTLQEKSITAGISPLGEEGDRQVLDLDDRFGVMFVALTASFIAGLPSVFQRLFAQRVRQQVEAEHEGHQRDVGGSAGWMKERSRNGWRP